ncbi:Crp/Fnr family transcriptional regulator (plasmid) [Aminobacter sp. SR38]|jgi:CRP-like cAMP-binding protein|uniref:Crp/Fnr family transcriptional regulator n=1 Tax=Aminobacter niigataensis TaxID=83265 RepID=UPI000831DE60|nr:MULTISPECIES: Crp/Fnr family transcriptional regulator [Aminobacter]MRX32121.1 cyclic nucleotide-binding domain-containing protein [Aminobacter sp. MDW-2]QNH37602.1 Crp/Fnr family transcriptional regulator [Aminobacter sp. MDW-2]QOF74744.1 Crp/Fnr family transcriptional regulator [Aminobacter sp. SR38]
MGARVISPEQFLASVFWARELPEDERERARRGIMLRVLEPGTYFIHRGDRIDNWIGVVSGLLRLGSITTSGKAVTYAGLPPSCWFGEGSLLKDEPRQYDVLALRRTQVALLNRATFFWLFENSVAFDRLLVRLINERLGQFIAQVEHDRTLDSTGKVARSLASLFNPVISPFVGKHIDISQEEIGLLAGVSRPVANRILQELEKEGLLRSEGGGVTILDLDKLRHYGE